MRNDHLVPDIIKDMVRKYKMLPDGSNEKLMYKARLDSVVQYIKENTK